MKEGITILLVEVYAPAYDKSYDMRVEEQTSIQATDGRNDGAYRTERKELHGRRTRKTLSVQH